MQAAETVVRMDADIERPWTDLQRVSAARIVQNADYFKYAE